MLLSPFLVLIWHRNITKSVWETRTLRLLYNSIFMSVLLVLPYHCQQPQINFPITERRFADIYLREKLTCLCLISSFFCSRKAEGMPAMFSWALSSRGHRSFMNSRAFFPFRKPVRLICIILLSGCCNTHTKGGEKRPYGHWNNGRQNIRGG